MSKIFTEKELRELEIPYSELALDALKKGDIEQLKTWIKGMTVPVAGLNALTIATIVRNWSKWFRDFGESKTIKMLDKIGDRLMQPFYKRNAPNSKEFIEDIISLFKHHTGAEIIPVVELDDTIHLKLTPCGFGGTNLLRKFDQKLPAQYQKTAAGIPIECVSCKSLQKSVNKKLGKDYWTTTIDNKNLGHCKMTFKAEKKLFNVDELEKACQIKPVVALNKIANNDFDVAELIVDQQKEWSLWHDALMMWTLFTFSGSMKFGGMDYHEQCLKDGYNSAFNVLYNSMEQMNDRERVFALAQNWHYHQGKFTIEEEEDRFAFKLDPCGSGGRLFREEMALDFNYGTDFAPILKDSHSLTFNRENFPLYCTHCASSNLDQFNGKPLIFVVDGHAQMKKGLPCRQYVWKKEALRKVEKRLLDQVKIINIS